MADPGGGNKPVPYAPGELDPSFQMLLDYINNGVAGMKDDIRNTLQSAPNINIPVNLGGITLDSITQNARSLMPKVLLDSIDNMTTPAGPDLGVKPGSRNAPMHDMDKDTSYAGPQGIGQIPSSAVLNQPNSGQQDPALAMLTQSLGQEVAQLDQQVAEKSTEAEKTTQTLDNALQVRDHFANTKFNDELMQIVGPDRIIVQRLPKGTKNISRSPGVETTVDPVSGEVLVHVPQKFMQEAPHVQQNDTKIAKAIVEDNPNQVKTDVEAEFRKLQGLTGDALSQGISNLNIMINLELAKQQKRIQDSAAMQSGFFEAQAAVQKNLQLDMTSGFTQRFNAASAQTQAAQNRLASIQATATNLANQLYKSDSEIAKLMGIKENLLKFESKREVREARKEDKMERLQNSVTQQELTNYHFAFGNSGNDDRDRETIALRRDKDKVMSKVLSTTRENVWGHLVDPSNDVRTKTLKLVEEYDRAANGKGADETIPTVKIIRKYVENPDLIMEDAKKQGLITPSEAKNLDQQLRQAGLGKEFGVKKEAVYGSLLSKIVQNHVFSSYTNMAGWVFEEGPLKDTVKKVAKTNPTGAAPTKDVINAFMFQDFPGPDGKPLSHSDKEKLLQRAFDITAANEFKTYLIPDIDAIKVAFGSKLRNQLLQARFVKSLTGSLIDPANANVYSIFP